jgi:hypothetical protein
MSDLTLDHAHPCNFRLGRHQDRGWGELAVEYRWDSTSGLKAEDSMGNPDLSHCFLYELTHYEINNGTLTEGCFLPCCPPFENWRFRHPTDGRTGPVGYECFAATQGWAWDRHKLGGRLLLPDTPSVTTITATQEYRFTCKRCGLDQRVPGPDAGPHHLLRKFAPREERERSSVITSPVWRYSLSKHSLTAWMEIDTNGYVADSAGIGFGPW